MKRGYVPMRHDFESTEEAEEMAGLLRREDESFYDAGLRVEALCRRLWSWLDLTREDGMIRGKPELIFENIDGRLRCPGFAAAMASPKVGWIRVTDDGVEFPNLVGEENWIKSTARRRAKDRDRKREARARASSQTGRAGPHGAGRDVRADDAVDVQDPPTRAGARAGQGKGSSTSSSEVETPEEAVGAPRCDDAPQPEQPPDEPEFSTSWLVPYYKTHQEFVGEPSRLRLENALRLIHDKYGEGRVVPVWRYFCETTTGRYVTPESFAQKFVALEREMRTGGASTAGRALTAAEQSMQTAQALTDQIDPEQLGASKSLAEIIAEREDEQRPSS